MIRALSDALWCALRGATAPSLDNSGYDYITGGGGHVGRQLRRGDEQQQQMPLVSSVTSLVP